MTISAVVRLMLATCLTAGLAACSSGGGNKVVFVGGERVAQAPKGSAPPPSVTQSPPTGSLPTNEQTPPTQRPNEQTPPDPQNQPPGQTPPDPQNLQDQQQEQKVPAPSEPQNTPPPPQDEETEPDSPPITYAINVPPQRTTPTAAALPRQSENPPSGYSSQWGLTAIKAAAAHASIRQAHGGDATPGAGIKVGVFDSGVEALHPKFEGKRVVEYAWSGAVDSSTRTYWGTHGTVVASVIAETAPGVDFESYAIPLGSANRARPYVAQSLSSLRANFNSRWAGRMNFMLRQDIDVLNLSLGVPGIIDDYDRDNLRESLSDAIAAMAQAYKDPSDRTVLVWAAGNANGRACLEGSGMHCDLLPPQTSGDPCEEGSSWYCLEDSDGVHKIVAQGDSCKAGSSPYCRYSAQARGYRMVRGGTIHADSVEVLPGLMAYYENLQEHSVAVVSVSQAPDSPAEPAVSSFSNRCGIAKDYCIAAPGDGIMAASFRVEDGSLTLSYRSGVRGTSLAAPYVTAGVALVMHRFRGQLSPSSALRRLFLTANKEGIYANADIYGQGLMDLDAATQAVGTSSIASGTTVDSPGASLHSTRLSLGPAFGAGGLAALAGREVAAFDSLGAPFWHDLGSLASTPSQYLGRQLRRMLDAPMSEDALHPQPSVPPASGVRLGLAAESPGYLGLGGPALAMSWGASDSPLAASAFTTEGREGQPPANGLALFWKPMGLRAGLVAERESALGARAEGGFGKLSAASAFAAFDSSRPLGSWMLDSSVELGVTDPSAGQGMLAEMDSALATRFALGAARSAKGAGRVRLSLEQPLRVERASAIFWAPVGRTRAGAVIRQRWRADLAPSGRQIDLSAQWTARASTLGQLRLNATIARHPGHDASASPLLSLLAGYRIAF